MNLFPRERLISDVAQTVIFYPGWLANQGAFFSAKRSVLIMDDTDPFNTHKLTTGTMQGGGLSPAGIRRGLQARRV